MLHSYIMVLIILVITFLCGLFYTNVSAKEENPAEYYKYYTSIEVKSGDTLWSIANRYMNEKYSSVQEYIDEVMYMNNMTSDQIIEGHYLTISYYSDQYQ